MKLLLILITSLALVGTAYASGEVKEVCTPKVDKAGKPVNDKKTGKQAQDCKKIKVHKKVEGEKVPEPAKKDDKKKK
jgi:predicted pyridoxine 5'-phosphate oxidase superfamily flavin-nucleotide-binding protein